MEGCTVVALEDFLAPSLGYVGPGSHLWAGRWLVDYLIGLPDALSAMSRFRLNATETADRVIRQVLELGASYEALGHPVSVLFDRIPAEKAYPFLRSRVDPSRAGVLLAGQGLGEAMLAEWWEVAYFAEAEAEEGEGDGEGEEEPERHEDGRVSLKELRTWARNRKWVLLLEADRIPD
jgi:hypothetical protein